MGDVKPLDPRLLKYARSARIYIAVSAVLGFVTAALVIIQALLISHTAAPVIEGHTNLFTVILPLSLLAVVTLTRALSMGLRQLLAQRAADGAIRELRSSVLDKIQQLSPRWRAVHGADAATLTTRALDDLRPYFIEYLPQLILMMTVTPLALLTMLFLDFWSALIATLTVPLIPIFMILVGRFTQESSKRKLAAMQRLSSQLLDLMAGLPTLRALGREKAPTKHIERLGKQNTKTTMATLALAFLSGGVLEFLATLCVALVAVEVGMRLVGGHISLTSGLAVIMLAPEVFEPLRQVGAQFHASANGVAAAHAAFKILETPTAHHGDEPAPDMSSAAIDLENLSVAARGMWAPHDLTATIYPRSINALIGPSGSGKTTTIMTILGLEQPTRGHIFISPNGHPHPDVDRIRLDTIDLNSWWEQLTWVPQSPTFVPGSIRSNLPSGLSDEQLHRAARQTGFDDVIASLPQGWDTPIGQGGVGLSQGQCQRLALTRALVDQSPVVVLDEPTAHLDSMSEEVVINALRSLRDRGSTVVVIAHRPAVISAADHVIAVTSAPATAEDAAMWPQLTHIDELDDLSVTLPEFLDKKQLEDQENATNPGGGHQSTLAHSHLTRMPSEPRVTHTSTAPRGRGKHS